jgi:gas vesicle protein
MNSVSTKNVGNEQDEWKSTLGFYKDELNVYKNRLTEVAGKNTSNEISSLVEHFQNQFLVQGEKIDQLKHDIKRHAKTMGSEIQETADQISAEHLGMHVQLKERVDTENKIFSELKEEFHGFLSRVM